MEESVTVDWLLTGNLRSLEEMVLAKKIEVSFLHEDVNQLQKEIIDEPNLGPRREK